MTSEKREGFSFAATVLGFIVDGAQVVSWVLSLVSAIVLASQPQAPQIPGFNFKLGHWYQIALLLCFALAYVHFLRRQWVKDDSNDDPLSNTFHDFLWSDLPGLKRSFLLIPVLLFYSVWLVIGISTFANNGNDGFLILMAWMFLLIIPLAKISVLKDADALYDLRQRWNEDEDLQNRWTKRINKKLKEFGVVNTEIFEDNIGLSLTSSTDIQQINWAIRSYFHLYEFEEDLVLSEKYSVIRGERPNEITIWCYELRYREQHLSGESN